MKKFLKLTALLAVLSVLFAGCPPDNVTKPGKEGDVAVTSITILVDGYQETPPYAMFIGETVDLSAQVLPGNATEKGYTFELVDNNGVLELSEDNELTALKDGTATVKVTSLGQKADGSFATDTLLVTVSDDPSGIVPKLFIHNQNPITDPLTTTRIPELNSSNRYVIANNEENANLPSGWTSVAGNTIVYLNKPIKISPVPNTAPIEYTPFSISARVRIIGGRTSAPLNNTGNCLVTGIFTKPTTPVSAATPLYFVGFRHAWDGTKRMYASRDTDNSATSNFSTANAPDFEKVDTATDKKTGFQDQEYVIKVERTNSNTYTISVYKADGVTLIASNTRGSGSNQANIKLQSTDDYYYLGFIISGVTVEISSIVIKDGTETVFSAAADAVPFPVSINRVNITTAKVEPGDGYDYQCLKTAFPGGGVQLAAEVLPSDASQTITWSISKAGASATVSSGGLVTATGSGTFTVKAQSAGTAFAEYKFNIYEQVPPVTSISVRGPTNVMAGNGSVNGNSINLVADVLPIVASDTADITWSVKADDGTSATTAATINATTGALKATDSAIASDTVVKVFASSTKGAGGATVTSPAYPVTIQKYSSSMVYVLKTKTIGTLPNNGINSNSYDSGTARLTINGDGVVDGGNLNLNLVYVVLPNEDFVATVNVHSFVGAASNNSKAGLWTFFDNPANGLGGSSNPTYYLHVGLNNTDNTMAEMRKDSTSSAGRTPLGTATATYPKTFRITYTKSNNRFVVAVPTDSGGWVDGSNRTYTVSGEIYLGLGVSSNNVSTHGSAVFSDFVINGTAVNLGQTITAP